MSEKVRSSSINALPFMALLATLPASLWADASGSAPPRFAFDCTATTTRVSADEPFVGEVSSAIARKWNLGAAPTDVMESKVTIRVCLSTEGHVDQMLLIAADGPSEDAVTSLFETARRAIIRADMDGGLPLPPEKYDTWRVLDLVFDANGMRLR